MNFRKCGILDARSSITTFCGSRSDKKDSMRILYRTFIKAPVVAASFGVGVASFVSWKFENMFTFAGLPESWFTKSNGTVQKNDTEQNKDQANSIDFKKIPNPCPDSLSLGTDLCLLSSKWMEIHTLISSLSENSNIKLPTIVVIGSQSSGKSSLLEALVGHRFLPKGHQLVTRRPIRLNLIHSSEGEKYGEFPDLGFGKIGSFERIEQHLEELNRSVPNSEFVSDKPIILNIHSPDVPNLSLIDLPGYIQITTKDQPIELKDKIHSICEKYIQEPNVILAISAADVDLANSEALRAAKIVDPNGLRTIGVLTKMDLVSPEIGVKLLDTQDYELPFGFIGIVCGSNIKGEEYFKSNSEYAESQVGIHLLRNRLSRFLEEHLSKSLFITKKIIQTEIEETEYQLKARFSDKTPNQYLLEAVDSFKFNCQNFAISLKNSDIRSKIDQDLSNRVTQICRDTIWAFDQSNTADLKDEVYSFTKSGIGKVSVDIIHQYILNEIKNIVSQNPWNHHLKTQETIIDISKKLLDSETGYLINQIETIIQPLKLRVEFSPAEWEIGKKFALNLVEREICKVRQDLLKLQGNAQSPWRLRRAMRKVAQIKFDYMDTFLKESFDSDYPTGLLEDAKTALDLEEYLFKLWNRNYKSCSSVKNCPDVYLSLISDRLASSASLFIYHSLLTKTLCSLPRSIEAYFSSMGEDQIIEFVKENPEMHQLLDLNQKQSILKQALDKISELEAV